MIEASSPRSASPRIDTDLWPVGPPPAFDFDRGTLLVSPLTPSAPPPYTVPYDQLGDEPTGVHSDKSAPPPYTSDDPEPIATALLHRMTSPSSPRARLAVRQRVPLSIPRPRLSMSLTPRVGLRTATRAVVATPTLVVVSADGRIGPVPGLRSPEDDGYVPRLSDSDSESDRYSSDETQYEDEDETAYSSDSDYERDLDEDDGGADPQWFGRVALWSAASRRTAHRRSESTGCIPALAAHAETGTV